MLRALLALVALTATACASSSTQRSETPQTGPVGAPPHESPPATEETPPPVVAAPPEEHPALGATWQAQAADRICVRGRDLEVTRSCTCGEPHACDVIATAAGVDIRVALDSAGPAICTDCYPTTVRCALPERACEGSLAITVNGEAATEAATGPGCALADGACWDLAR